MNDKLNRGFRTIKLIVLVVCAVPPGFPALGVPVQGDRGISNPVFHRLDYLDLAKRYNVPVYEEKSVAQSMRLGVLLPEIFVTRNRFDRFVLADLPNRNSLALGTALQFKSLSDYRLQMGPDKSDYRGVELGVGLKESGIVSQDRYLTYDMESQVLTMHDENGTQSTQELKEGEVENMVFLLPSLCNYGGVVVGLNAQYFIVSLLNGFSVYKQAIVLSVGSQDSALQFKDRRGEILAEVVEQRGAFAVLKVLIKSRGSTVKLGQRVLLSE